ncbi:hypothetical protein MT418_003240 [Batrachochytrium dendrobatidis]
MLANLITLLMLLKYQDRLNPVYRLMAGFVIIAVVFTIALWMVHMDTLDAVVYFLLTLALVILTSFASALLAGIMGFAALYSADIVTTTVSGQGMSGVVPALSQLILMLSSPPTTDSITAMNDAKSRLMTITQVYFSVGVFISTVSCIGYILLQRSSHTVNAEHSYQEILAEPQENNADGENQMVAHSPNSSIQDHPISVTEGVRRIWGSVYPLALSLFLTFFVTLGLFPGITSLVQSTRTPYRTQLLPLHYSDTRFKELFVPLHFLIFAVADLIGKSLPMIPSLSRFHPKLLLKASLMRIALFPLLMICNVVITDRTGIPLPRTLPLVFTDISYFLILATLGVSGGWLTTLVFIAAPEAISTISHTASPREYERVIRLVNELMVITTATGLVFGSALSFLLRWILCGCNPFLS